MMYKAPFPKLTALRFSSNSGLPDVILFRSVYRAIWKHDSATSNTDHRFRAISTSTVTVRERASYHHRPFQHEGNRSPGIRRQLGVVAFMSCKISLQAFLSPPSPRSPQQHTSGRYAFTTTPCLPWSDLERQSFVKICSRNAGCSPTPIAAPPIP